MPRTLQLTWQQGTGNRGGRWKKQYRGQMHYFQFGTSKSDMDGYRQALETWRLRKVEVDAQELLRPKTHAAAYQSAVDEWTLALQFSVENRDTDLAQKARQKIDDLKTRLASPNPPPLVFSDRFTDQWLCPPGLLEEFAIAFDPSSPVVALEDTPSGTGRHSATLVTPAGEDDMLFTYERERLIWRDRLALQRAKHETTETTLAKCVDQFLAQKRAKVQAGALSAGRFGPLRGHLYHFRDWLGGAIAVKAINGKMLTDYHAELLVAVTNETWSADYAKDRMNAVKSFVQWLWQTEAIDELPRILTQKGMLTIAKRVRTPSVFTIDEVKAVLATATGRTRLYLLLMLNTGMTQKDISDLKQSEVDWAKGTITRKRSKTQSHKGVPTVTYRLWPKTLELLKHERAAGGDRVLVNRDGNPLKTEILSPAGKLQKNDNIKNAYGRLQRKANISKPLKLFRKTSANLLCASQEFNGVEDLFLGHSPRTMADRHYTQVPQGRLDGAIRWLGEQYGIDSLPADGEVALPTTAKADC